MMRSSLREGVFVVIWFDAADVVRRGGVQRLHQQLERVTELQSTKITQINTQFCLMSKTVKKTTGNADRRGNKPEFTEQSETLTL